MFKHKAVLILIAIALVTTIVYAAGWQAARNVTVSYSFTKVSPDGKRQAIGSELRILKGGEMRRKVWREGQLLNDQYVDNARNIYAVSDAKRKVASLPGKFDLHAPRPAKELLSLPQFNRTEQLLGITGYVIRMEQEGQIVGEIYFAPETDPLPLKDVSFEPDGTQHILEATSVEFGKAGEIKPEGYKIPGR